MHENKRISWIDVAKGICIICIVLGHVYHFSYIRTYCLSFDVPMFFFIGGLLYKHSDCWKEYVKKKVFSIVIPYIAFSTLSILVFYIGGILVPRLNTILNTSISDNLLVMLYGNSKPDAMKYYSPLWFLTCFFTVNVIAFLFESILRQRSDETSRLVRIISLPLIAVMGGGIAFIRSGSAMAFRNLNSDVSMV